MKYYAVRDIDEHYLFAKEITEFVFQRYGVASATGKPHYRMIKAMLDAYARDEGHEELFYQTRNGLCRVYQTDVANSVLKKDNWAGYYQIKGLYGICVAGKWWKYRLVGCNEQKKTD